MSLKREKRGQRQESKAENSFDAHRFLAEEYRTDLKAHHNAWRTIPLKKYVEQAADADGYASIYALEGAVADAELYSKEQARRLIEAAIHDGHLVQKGEWVELNPELFYKEICEWEEKD